MSYDVVIEQVKALPEQLLTSVSAFIVAFFMEQLLKQDSIFFIVSDDYIDYLLKIENHVMKSKCKLYGTLRFNCMIPVPESELLEYRINDEGDFNYRMLMLSEYNFCKENREKIEKTAKNLYAKKCSCDDNLFPLGKIVVDFKKVEKACINYRK